MIHLLLLISFEMLHTLHRKGGKIARVYHVVGVFVLYLLVCSLSV